MFEKIIIYKDHYNYSDNDVEHICRVMKNLDCKSIITSTKDYYKLIALNKNDMKIRRLKMEFYFLDTMDMPSQFSSSKKNIITHLLDKVLSNAS